MIAWTFDPEGHIYRLNGKIIPSVSLLCDHLMSFDNVSVDVLAAARERGTDVHHATYLDDIRDLAEESITDEIRPYLTGWRKFMREMGPQWIVREHQGVNVKREYGYQFDALGTIQGFVTLVEIKTCPFNRVMGIQLAGYETAWNEELTTKEHEKVQRRAVVSLDKKGGYKYRACTERSDYNAFLSLLTLHRWSNED